MQWGRVHQGKVPDYKFLLNTPIGLESSLASLKIISSGKSNTPEGRIHDVTNPEKDILRQGCRKREALRIGRRIKKMY